MRRPSSASRPQNLLGHTAVWPAAGMAGRAMIPWNDDQAQLVRPNGARPHNVRIVMTAADTTLLHAANNVMSNDWMPCTVIYDERDVYYGTSRPPQRLRARPRQGRRASASSSGFQRTSSSSDSTAKSASTAAAPAISSARRKSWSNAR